MIYTHYPWWLPSIIKQNKHNSEICLTTVKEMVKSPCLRCELNGILLALLFVTPSNFLNINKSLRGFILVRGLFTRFCAWVLASKSIEQCNISDKINWFFVRNNWRCCLRQFWEFKRESVTWVTNAWLTHADCMRLDKSVIRNGL